MGFDGWPSRHDQILPRDTDRGSDVDRVDRRLGYNWFYYKPHKELSLNQKLFYIILYNIYNCYIYKYI